METVFFSASYSLTLTRSHPGKHDRRRLFAYQISICLSCIFVALSIATPPDEEAARVVAWFANKTDRLALEPFITLRA